MSRKSANRSQNRKPHRAALIETLERRALLTVGALDPTFGAAGIQSLPGYTAATQLHAGLNGQFLVTTSAGVLRLNSTGAVDTTFGNDGLSTAAGFTPVDVVVESSGKILVAGTTSQHRLAVAQLNTDGSLDTTFGTSGIATVREAPSLRLTASAILLQSNSQIIVAGQAVDPYVDQSDPSYSTAILVRLNSTGALDTTYGTNGVSDIGDGYSAPTVIKLNSSLQVVATAPLVGSTADNPTTELVRDSSDGKTVTTYTDTSGDGAIYSSLILDTSGRPIVYRADAYGNTAIEAFNSTGTDTTFGSSGYAEVPTGFTGMAPVSDGSFYVVNRDTTLGALVVRHYTSAGLIDHTFGTVGVAAPALSTAAGSTYTFTGPMLALANGDIVAAGVDSRGKLVLAEVQLTSQGNTNPTASTTSTFAPPPLGRRYGYVTVTYNQGPANLNVSTLAPHGVTVLKTTADDSSPELITATLVSDRGGNGSPVTAVYAFPLASDGAVSAADAGTYQFAIGSDAIEDANSRGNPGTYGTSYLLYFSHPTGGSRSRPVAVTTTLDPDPL